MFVVQSGLCNISHNILLLINDIENILIICSFRLKMLFEILQIGKCSNGITNVCCLRETLAQQQNLKRKKGRDQNSTCI